MQPINGVDSKVYGDEFVIPTRIEHVRSNIFLLQLLNCGTRYIARFSDSVDQDKLLGWISNGYLLLTWYEGEDYNIIPFDEFRHDRMEAGENDPLEWFICPFCLEWVALGEYRCSRCIERELTEEFG
jgi:hypothetical protein